MFRAEDKKREQEEEREDEILLFRCALLSEGEKRNLRRGKSDSSVSAACEFLVEIINFLFPSGIYFRPTGGPCRFSLDRFRLDVTREDLSRGLTS